MCRVCGESDGIELSATTTAHRFFVLVHFKSFAFDIWCHWRCDSCRTKRVRWPNGYHSVCVCVCLYASPATTESKRNWPQNTTNATPTIVHRFLVACATKTVFISSPISESIFLTRIDTVCCVRLQILVQSISQFHNLRCASPYELLRFFIRTRHM